MICSVDCGLASHFPWHADRETTDGRFGLIDTILGIHLPHQPVVSVFGQEEGSLQSHYLQPAWSL